jgi:hypothetical protein
MSDHDISLERQKAALLEQMAQIPRIIRGKLTSQTYVTKGRSQGPYFTLQRWEEGKNKSQRISSQDLPMIQDALTGYERFEQLAGQFVGLAEKQTWEDQPDDVKKKFRKFSRASFPTPAPSSRKRARK